MTNKLLLLFELIGSGSTKFISLPPSLGKRWGENGIERY